MIVFPLGAFFLAMGFRACYFCGSVRMDQIIDQLQTG